MFCSSPIHSCWHLPTVPHPSPLPKCLCFWNPVPLCSSPAGGRGLRRSWSCCPSTVGYMDQRNPVMILESPGPIATWAMLCHHPLLPLAVVIPESHQSKQFFLHLELISPGLRLGWCEARMLCATTTWLCLRVQRSLFKPVQTEDVHCHILVLQSPHGKRWKFVHQDFFVLLLRVSACQSMQLYSISFGIGLLTV